MKTKLLLLLLLLSSCTLRPVSPLIVTSVTLNDSDSGNRKYMITLNGMTTMYTDSLYAIGDTIK